MIKEKEFTLMHLSLDDLQGYWETMQDSKTAEGFTSVPTNIDEAKKEIEEYIDKMKKGVSEIFTIEINEKYAGNVRLDYQNWDPNSGEGRLHLWLHPKFRGKGLATKALQAIIDYGFNEKNMHTIYAQCKKTNKAVCKVLERAGLTFVEEKHVNGVEKLWWKIKKPDTIKTERLILREWQSEDSKDYVNLVKDKKLIFSNAPYPYTEEHYFYWLKHKQEDIINLAIIEKESNEIIGLFFISQIDKEKNDCLIGYGLSKKARGKGYITEAGKRIIEYVNNELKITKIRAETNRKNIGSHNVLKKLGFNIVNKIIKDHNNRFTNEPEDKWFWRY